MRMREIGVVAAAYFLTPAFRSQVGPATRVIHFGFSDDVIKGYLEPEIFANDPVPDHVMRTGRAMTWAHATAAQKLSEPQREFICSIRAAKTAPGISVPLYGPNGRDSYSAFSFGRRIGRNDEALVTRVIEIAQMQHLKVCWAIARGHKSRIAVSRREREVVYWMARGKSNADIACILGIAPRTVDTFVRRLYAKLGVNDRIAAVVEAMSRGLVKL